MVLTKKIQYISPEHKEARKEIRLEIESQNPIQTGNLNIAQFEYYKGLRAIVVKSDLGYVKQLPLESPTKEHLDLAERLYNDLPLDALFF